ncbi:MAG: PIG-L family deacetylase [Candidatus Levybacteria bacterium]|nr:PIG-L family deacetylase [Candidatus Levybacteria bacterium]
MMFNQSNNFTAGNNSGMIKAAIVVAHPDDEIIWVGGTLLVHKDWHWKIYIATHNKDDDRGKECINGINQLKGQGISNLEYEFLETMPDVQEYEKLNKTEIYGKLNTLDLAGFNIIFTHNIDGEYGHGNHKILGEFFKESQMNVWHILCPAIQNPRVKQVGGQVESSYLTPTVLKTKRDIFQNSYPTQNYLWNGFTDFMTFQFYSGVEMFTR